MKVPIDILVGVTDKVALDIAKFLGFSGKLADQCAEQVKLEKLFLKIVYFSDHHNFKVKRLYKLFIDVDCLQLEVNPLAETPGNQLFSLF